MADLISPRMPPTAAATALPGVDLLSIALRAVGSERFYPAVVAWVGSVIPNEIWFVTQYSRSQKPVILHDNWDRSDAKAYYMDGVHEYDPTYHVLGDEVLMTGTSMAHVADRFSLDRRYADYLDNVARIRDELIIVLPRLDDRYIAIGLDRSAERFSSDEIELARTLSSLLAEMHRLHVERASGGADGDLVQMPTGVGARGEWTAAAAAGRPLAEASKLRPAPRPYATRNRYNHPMSARISERSHRPRAFDQSRRCQEPQIASVSKTRHHFRARAVFTILRDSAVIMLESNINFFLFLCTQVNYVSRID
jgi:hypothetical protein